MIQRAAPLQAVSCMPSWRVPRGDIVDTPLALYSLGGLLLHGSYETLCTRFTRSLHWRKAELCFFVGFLCSRTLCQNLARVSQNFTRSHLNFIDISPEFRQNIELEHLKKGDNHNSAFPELAPKIVRRNLNRSTLSVGGILRAALVSVIAKRLAHSTWAGRRGVWGCGVW